MTNSRLGSSAALFVVGAVSMYAGAAIAVDLFDDVSPQSVAWLRVCGAALVLGAAGRPWRVRWTAGNLSWAVAFGVITTLMNTCFYLAADRLPLGTTVAIEFLGPIAVAALSSRTARGFGALLLGASGVAMLAGIQLSGSAIGVAYAAAAAAAWAGYIVLGNRVSGVTSGVEGLAVGLGAGAVLFTPVGAPSSGAVWAAPHLLVLCLVVGVLSTALPYGIDQVVFRRVDRGTFALLLALLPATATVVGAVALRQHLRVAEYAGIVLVIAALVTHASGGAPRVHQSP